MLYPYGGLRFPAPFSQPTVDDIANSEGIVPDSFEPVSLEVKDKPLMEGLNQRIEDSREYYNDINGFDLERKRTENLRYYLGMQADPEDYYDGEDPYVENQIRRAIDSIVAYATARSPQSVVTPADETPQSKKFASNLEKAHNLHSVEFDLRGIIEVCVRSWMLNQQAYIMLEFDPDHGDKGEIVPRFIPCEELVIDKDARFGEDPGFIAIYEKRSLEEILYTFPEKRNDILSHHNIQRIGSKNIQEKVILKKVWFSYFTKKGEKLQAVAVYYDDFMLGKFKDPNWLEGQQNFLKAPTKPIIPLNVINDGKHYVDFSNPLEDGIRLQKNLNSRGRQISQNAERSNGTMVIDGQGSGLTKEDAENWTEGPGQKIYLKKKKAGVKIEEVIYQIPGRDVKQFVVQDKQDVRQQIGSVMGVPVDQSRSDQTSDDTTLGEQLLRKSNDDARQDMIVRAVDRMLYRYFNLLTQMMFVWYDEDHFFPWLDEDGSFERIVIKRYYFDDGMRVNVKGSSTIAWDKNREQAMATKLVEADKMSLLDYYRIAGFENPQKLYDNWVKQTKDPYELVRDANRLYDDGDAYAEFLEFMNNKQPEMKPDASKDYILTLRKLMLSSKFLKAPAKCQSAFVSRLTTYLDDFELRTSLDQLGQIDIQKLMTPNQQIPRPLPDQQFQQMLQGPQQQLPPGGAPPQPGAPGPGSMPPQQPPQGGGAPGQPGIFSGTPLMNPASPQTPSGLSAIPSI